MSLATIELDDLAGGGLRALGLAHPVSRGPGGDGKASAVDRRPCRLVVG